MSKKIMKSYALCKKYAKDFWKYLIESDTAGSWLANAAIAFILMRFVLYPLLAIIFGTGLPLVAVVSGSMEHMIISHESDVPIQLCGNKFSSSDRFVNFDSYWNYCGEWYTQYNITSSQFSKFMFKDGFNKGDIMVIKGVSPDKIMVGDVIVFRRSFMPEPIIHRVVAIAKRDGKLYFLTKGDHNNGSGNIDINIQESEIEGKAVFRVPYLGWVKVWLTDFISFIGSFFAK